MKTYVNTLVRGVVRLASWPCIGCGKYIRAGLFCQVCTDKYSAC